MFCNSSFETVDSPITDGAPPRLVVKPLSSVLVDGVGRYLVKVIRKVIPGGLTKVILCFEICAGCYENIIYLWFRTAPQRLTVVQ